jgi:hypothetical protein
MRQRRSKGLSVIESWAGAQPGSAINRCGVSALGEELHSNGAIGADRALSLSQRDRSQLEECEEIIGRGLSTFFDVGSALLNIRDKRLYRGAHKTFEMYCRERWGIGRSYAWRLIGAAVRLNLLPAGQGLLRPPVVGKNVIGWGRAGRRVFRAGVVRSSNGGPSGEGAERMFASRRESTRSTPPVGPAILDP